MEVIRMILSIGTCLGFTFGAGDIKVPLCKVAQLPAKFTSNRLESVSVKEVRYEDF